MPSHLLRYQSSAAHNMLRAGRNDFCCHLLPPFCGSSLCRDLHRQDQAKPHRDPAQLLPMGLSAHRRQEMKKENSPFLSGVLHYVKAQPERTHPALCESTTRKNSPSIMRKHNPEELTQHQAKAQPGRTHPGDMSSGDQCADPRERAFRRGSV